MGQACGLFGFTTPLRFTSFLPGVKPIVPGVGLSEPAVDCYNSTVEEQRDCARTLPVPLALLRPL